MWPRSLRAPGDITLAHPASVHGPGVRSRLRAPFAPTSRCAARKVGRSPSFRGHNQLGVSDRGVQPRCGSLR
jgi:hypothetical protein